MKTVEEMTIQELKVLAYDTISDIETFQNNLRIINQEITKRKSLEDKPESKKTKA